MTSKGEPALGVLQAKIPEEIRRLTVALLASDREGVRQFQASIEAIQHQVSPLNPEETRRQIDLLHSAIDKAHSELSAIDRRTDEIALAQLSDIAVDGTPMRAQKLVEMLVRGEDNLGWFPDRLSLSEEHRPPLSDAEAAGLREARRRLGPDLVYSGARIPSADAPPVAAEIGRLHEVLCRLRAIEDGVARGRGRLGAMGIEPLGAATTLPDIVEQRVWQPSAKDGDAAAHVLEQAAGGAQSLDFRQGQ